MFFQKSDAIQLWLVLCMLTIIGMITLGGATRLTESGLSIVEWKPLSGIVPPLNETEWEKEFDHYKEFPEYALKHKHMVVEDFKFIFWMEFSHRLLGRFLGLLFFIPMLYFWRHFDPSVKQKMIVLLFLGASQGGMGWFMVKSGLVSNPYVSHYRLCAHLLLAFALIALMHWTLLEVKQKSNHFRSTLRHFTLRKKDIMIPLFLLLLTITYGAFVAGLRAGHMYNTFPLMGGEIMPGEWAYYEPLWINFFKNPATVQWTHRWLGIITMISVFSLALKIIRQGGFYGWTLLFMMSTQIVLGILTLLYVVPVSLALLHQAGAVVLLLLIVGILYRARLAH